MNTLESYSITNPKNVTDECAKFVIDDTGSPFILSEIMQIGTRYTFSFWIKSEADSSIRTAGSTFTSTTEWQKHSIVFTATSKDLAISFLTTGMYYIYHPKLELGNMVTDWSPAPEDTTDDIISATDDVRSDMAEQNAATLDSCNEMVDSALDDYVHVSEYGSFKETVETEFAVRDDEITMNFTTIETKVNNLDGDVQSKFQELNKHISFSENGITISAGENAMSIRIDNDIVVFEKNGVQFGWWDGIDFHTGNIVVNVNERAQFGNFAYVPRSDGSLSFLKVGE